MVEKTGENLRRVMSRQGLTVGDVVRRARLDRRTIQGILDGTNKPHPRTIGRLASGLGVTVDEFYVDPAQLLYRRFDRQTNPVIAEVVDARPELFAEWTEADFDELHSRFGTGGPLTPEGAVKAVEAMNSKRQLHEKLSLLLESSQADVVRGMLDVLYQQVVADKDRVACDGERTIRS